MVVKYNSIMMFVAEFGAKPICYNFDKSKTYNEVCDILGKYGYELDKFGEEVNEEDLNKRTFICNIE